MYGYLDGPNLLAKRQDVNVGLSLIKSANSAYIDRAGNWPRVCVAGPVSYMGCGSDPNIICTDAAFDYAVTVREPR